MGTRWQVAAMIGLTWAASLAWAQPPLRWAADAEGGAPYIFPDPDRPGHFVGFEVEIAEALAERLGRPLRFIQYSFDQLLPGVERGDFDVAMNGLEVTPDRLRKVRFTQPYYTYRLQLVGRAGETRFQSLDECTRVKGLVIGTLEDTAALRLLERLGIRAKIYTGQTEPYTDLALGRIDGVLLDLPIATYIARPRRELAFVGPPLEPGYYAIALHRDRADLAREVDAALAALKEDGTLQRILTKWHLWDDAQPKLLETIDYETEIAGQADVMAEAAAKFTFSRYFPELLSAAGVTVFLTFASFAVAVLIALPLALMRLYGPWPLRLFAILFIEFFRGIPVLLLLFFLYFFLPDLAAFLERLTGLPMDFLKLNPFVAAILGFGLNYAAYEAEIYRAGIAAIPVGQWEAAASLGLTRVQTFRRIILPQATRLILPPMTNDFVALFKDTSVVSVITIVELSKQYQMLAKSSFKYAEIGLATAALYLAMSVPLGLFSRWLEKVQAEKDKR
ncbi:MAG TPA: ABC transporter substrate-binding protein/permease [Gemmatales bacterium]|nr:ABC transporter substrate-binding protein/permease [Gemmatales bacterium]HMP58000.1 ABC transporter substrate-binding protein/permease [Gemmatales bacterium]